MREEIDLIVKNGTVITMDKERKIISEGAVAVRGNSIVDVGKTFSIEEKYQAKKILDGKKRLILPGLVDAHVHTCQELPRGLADDVDLQTWLSRITLFETNMTQEDAYWGSLLACLEMMKTGTTTFYEAGATPGFTDEVGQAFKDSGLRAILTRSNMDIRDPDSPVPAFFIESPEAAIRENEKLIKKWHGQAGGRISVGIVFRHTEHMSPELGRGLFEIARRNGITACGHVCSSLKHIEKVQSRYGCGEIEYLSRLGGLSNNLLIVHAIHLTEEDIERLRTNNVNVVHVPTGSMHAGAGAVSVGRFPEMIQKGINVALGCDSAAYNNNLDMIEELKFAALAHKEMRRNPLIMPSHTVVEMATLNGAKALALADQIGVLEPGKKADLILIDLQKPHWVPIHDIVSNLVHSANGSDVDTVIVDGQVIMEGRKVLTIDEERVLEEAQKRAENIRRRMNVEPPTVWKTV